MFCSILFQDFVFSHRVPSCLLERNSDVKEAARIISPMMTRRRVEIIAFERERIVRGPVATLCPVCHVNSELLTTRQAGAIAQVQSASIYRWLASGKAHGVRTSGGQYRVCKNSLFHRAYFSLLQSENLFAYEGDKS